MDCPVLAQCFYLAPDSDDLCITCLQVMFDISAMVSAIGSGGDKQLNILACYFTFCVTEDRVYCRVTLMDVALFINDDNGIPSMVSSTDCNSRCSAW